MCNLTGVQSGNSSTGVKGRKMGGIARSIGLFYVVAVGAGLVLLVVTILARSAYDALRDHWRREEVSHPSRSGANRVNRPSKRREA